MANQQFLLNNKDLQLKYITGYNGQGQAASFKNDIIRAKQSQFTAKNWPFKNQTINELILYLVSYQAVMYLNVPSVGWQFYPIVKDRPYLTKSNVHLANITIQDYFNQRIVTNAFRKTFYKDFPFIFMNSLQTSLLDEMETLYISLERVRNFQFANSLNKQPLSIVRVPKGTKLQDGIFRYMTNPDGTGILYIEDETNSKGVLKNTKPVPEMRVGGVDLSVSYETEAQQLEQRIKNKSAVITNNVQSKTSAQETDSQTNSVRVEAAFILKSQIDEIKKGVSNFNKNSGLKLEIDLTSEAFAWMMMGIASDQLNAETSETSENSETPATSETSDASIWDKIKNFFSKTEQEEVKEEVEAGDK